MKNSNLMIWAIVTTSLYFFLISFITRDQEKYSSVCYCYSPPQTDCNKKREISNNGPLSIVSTELNDSNNWTTECCFISPSQGLYLREICFEEEFDADGPSDHELTLQEAIDAVKDYFNNNNQTLPQNGQVITVGSSPNIATIIIKRSNCNCNCSCN